MALTSLAGFESVTTIDRSLEISVQPHPTTRNPEDLHANLTRCAEQRRARHTGWPGLFGRHRQRLHPLGTLLFSSALVTL
jgi:hypothetical protein